MKHNFLFILLLTIAFFSCKETDSNSGDINISKKPRNIYVDVSTIALEAIEKRAATINVKAENTGWEISNSATWLSVTPSSGRNTTDVNVSAQENVSVDEGRVTVLNIHSTESDYQYNKDITVSQTAADIYVTPSETSIICKATSYNKTISVNSNIDWVAECSQDWLAVNKVDNSKLNVSILENMSITRTATISFKRNGTSSVISTINITQEEAGVTSDMEDLYLLVDGDTKKIGINADLAWQAYTSASSWLSVSPDQGDGGHSNISITALPNFSVNARDAFVYVKIGDTNKLSIPIHQHGILISSETEKLSFGAGEGSQTISLYSNTTWEVVSCPSWLTITPSKGEQNPSIKIKVTAENNPNTTSRSGTIVIGKTGLDRNEEISVEQDGKKFSDLSDNLQFPNTSSSQELLISTDGYWHAVTSSSWIHLSPSSCNGSGTLNISVDANPDKEKREGKVLVTVGETTKGININQDGRYINLSCDNVLTKSTPSVIKMSISSNVNWTAKSDVAWMTITPFEGKGDTEVTISVADNPHISERSGHISVETVDETKVLSFTQPGRILTVDCTNIEMTGNGGFEQIKVTTDGKFDVAASDKWISCMIIGNLMRIYVEKNETRQTRNGSVTLSLTDLEGGETYSLTIDIKQLPQYINVGRDEFDDTDENWNL